MLFQSKKLAYLIHKLKEKNHSSAANTTVLLDAACAGYINITQFLVKIGFSVDPADLYTFCSFEYTQRKIKENVIKLVLKSCTEVYTKEVHITAAHKDK